MMQATGDQRADRDQAASAANMGALICPLPATAKFSDERFYIWCGSMARTDDGRCHLYYSRWARSLGHHAWVTHSEIAHAVADHPLGPYRHVDVTLPPRGDGYWDGGCTHNPTICRFGGRFYLYYTGMYGQPDEGEGLNWSYRNNQRIGVAVADRPEGPWQRFDEPLIHSHPGEINAICCSNPSVTRRPDGGYLMVYKAVRDLAAPPFFGPVVHLAATAEDPCGPFTTHPRPMFTSPGVKFPAEDPFIWHDGDRYRAIVKDMDGLFTDAGKALVQFESIDGLSWRLADHPLVSVPRLTWESGVSQKLFSLERPQVYLEDNVPRVLFCAADETPERTHSYNVHIPLAHRTGNRDTTPASPCLTPRAAMDR